MRKPIALLFAAALVLGIAGLAHAQQTYTWTLVESPSVALLWPNEANAPNTFEANGGLLGRIHGSTDPDVGNACELAPSYPCAPGSPPEFLLPAADDREGPSDGGAGTECNRKVIACNTSPVPGAGHGGHPAGNQDGLGEYSYLIIHTAAQGTNPEGKGIGFFAGSFVQQSDPYTCNDCAGAGRGRDENVAGSLNNTITQTTITSLSVSLWLTQSTSPFGHALVSLAPSGAGTGSSSVCGNGIAYQDLHTDLCVDGPDPGTGNFTIPDQKVVYHVYSTTMDDMASFVNQGRCNPPDCYIENVIIPAAAGATNVQVQVATSVLPASAPGTLANATVDSLIFASTTQLLDMDVDGTEDRSDPCPNDPIDLCAFIQDPGDPGFGTPCPAGQVYCSDALGAMSCIDSFLCNQRIDSNQDCVADPFDFVRTAGEDAPGGFLAFQSTVSTGPFDP